MYTADNMARAHCVLGTKGYKNALSDYVTLIVFLLHERASTVTLYVHCYTTSLRK